MTANEDIDKNRNADMFLAAVLSWVDNIFMKPRKLFLQSRAQLRLPAIKVADCWKFIYYSKHPRNRREM